MSTLVFPCNTFEAICFARQQALTGQLVFGATSVASEYDISEVYEQVFDLPHISSNEFEKSLSSRIKSHKITEIWTSIPSVHKCLSNILSTQNIKLLSCDPVERPYIPNAILEHELNSRRIFVNTLQKQFDSEVSRQLTHSLLKHTFYVSGESHLDKLLSIVHIYHTLPANTDIVEIGSLWGRTATLFSHLANIFQKGNLLCIDPWPSSGNRSQDTDSILDKVSSEYDGDKYFSIFCSNLMTVGQKRVNYFRALSNDAIQMYESLDGSLTTKEFGKTEYSKKIGLLHIDGNHKYSDVIDDINNYAKRVVENGWIIFDDYNWAFGDGVTRAADEYLIDNIEKIELAFFVGGALFVHLKPSV